MARSIATNSSPLPTSQQWDIVRTFSRLTDDDRAAILAVVGEAPPLSPAIRSGLSDVARSARKAA